MRRGGAPALLALLALLAPASAWAAAGADSVRYRTEFGGGSEYTNELYYSDTFTDTTFTGWKLVQSPEARFAGIWAGTLEGTRSEGDTRYVLRHELSLGDLLSRGALSLQWRSEPDPEWRWSARPAVEYRRDRTLGRDLEEWRGGATVRARREWLGPGAALEGGLGVETLRSSGRGSEYVLDRDAASAFLSLDRSTPGGSDARVGYRFAARAFPDSGSRDHYEHGGEARLRVALGAFSSVTAEAELSRRVAARLVPTSRDRFWEGRSALEAEWGGESAWGLRARLEGEALRYDVEDTTLFFDYQVVRARLGPRRDAGGMSLWFGPRAEALFSRLEPAEGYQEIGGFADLEFAGAHAFWLLAPAAGWRDYDEDASAGVFGAGSLHSSFAFAELGMLADQPLFASWRARLLAQARLESHIDSSQDATSLYFSFDVRTLF